MPSPRRPRTRSRPLASLVVLAGIYGGGACGGARQEVGTGAVDAGAEGSVETVKDASVPDRWVMLEAGARDAADAADAAPTTRSPLPTPPSGGGLGATVLDDGGVSFGVWAPSATGVDVEGTFAPTPVTLTAVDGGIFEGRVAAARAGDSYRYRIHSGTALLDRLDPRARDVDGGAAVIVDPRAFPWSTPPFAMPPKNESILYELHVGSFSAAGGGHGTFASAIGKLDWLASLGVTAIELMPANDFGSDDGWGYNPSSYFAPHPSFGRADDLRALVDAAHARGIGVVLDVVYNHYEASSGAPLDCFDGACPDGGAGIYFFGDPTYATTPWGPRPDYASPRVSDFITDGAFAWLAESRVDGLRWDSVSNIRAIDGSGAVPGGAPLLQRANDAIHALRPDALLIAEDLKGDAQITASTGTGGLGFDTQWDGFAPVVAAVAATTDAARNLDAVRAALAWSYNGDPYARVLYTESHDTVGNGGVRLPNAIDPSAPTSLTARKGTLLATLALLTAPAVPMLFMGEEMLATGTFVDPGAPSTGRSRPRMSRSSPSTAPRSARRNLDGVTAGLVGMNVDVFHLNETAKVMVYRRYDAAGNDVVVALNFGATAYTSYLVGLPEGGTWHVRLNADDTQYGADFGGASSADVVAASTPRDAQPYTGSLALGAYAGVIFVPLVMMVGQRS